MRQGMLPKTQPRRAQEDEGRWLRVQGPEGTGLELRACAGFTGAGGALNSLAIRSS